MSIRQFVFSSGNLGVFLEIEIICQTSTEANLINFFDLKLTFKKHYYISQTITNLHNEYLLMDYF